jgi:hypothetical protein
VTGFLLLVVAIVLVCAGGLLGASWTTQVMGTVSRRHAAERRNLNDGWRELAAARQASGATLCPRCDQSLIDTSWLLVFEPPLDEEDDGT